MKKKLLNLGLIITLLTCYIDIWKYGQEFFLETELKFLPNMFDNPIYLLLLSILLSGQIFLILGYFASNLYWKIYTKIGLTCSTIIFLLIFSVSVTKLLSLLSTVPYLVLTIITMISLHRHVKLS